MAGRGHYKGRPKDAPEDVVVSSISDGPHLDPFTRQRVSENFTLFDSVHNRSKQEFLWEEITQGAGTSIWQQNRSSVYLTVGAASGDKVVRASRQHMHYQPGKGMLCLFTGVLSVTKENLRQRVGYFDANNGLFFEAGDSGLSVVIRSFVSGSPVNTTVPQSHWNLDPLNGGGDSRVLLDTTKAQIFVIDFQWLGVGRVRFGFMFDGTIVYCHESDFSNSITSVYMTQPDLPCRYEIENVGPTSGGSTLEQICSTVISEGGHNPRGKLTSVNTGTAGVAVAGGGVRKPLVSIRLGSNYNRAHLLPLSYSALSLSNDDLLVEVIVNATLSGAVWVPVVNGSYCEFDTASIGLSGGTCISSEFTSQQAGGSFIEVEVDQLAHILSATISGVSDTLTLSVASVGSSASAAGSLNVKEVG